MTRRQALSLLLAPLVASALHLGGCSPAPERIRVYSAAGGGEVLTDRIVRSPAEWRRLLTPAQYHVLRERGTEPAFTGLYYKTDAPGVYHCAGCGLALFDARTKYDSGTGWPSFFAPFAEENIALRRDSPLVQVPNEVICARCEGHLGHVFDDGPAPTWRRYCINSVALRFVPDIAPTE